MKKILLILGVIALSLAGCSNKIVIRQSERKQSSITVSAAASLQKSLTEIEPEFEKKNGIKIAFNFGSSGALQKQIENGAPADVFISAGKSQMDALESKNLIDKGSRKNILSNKLLLIVSNEYKGKIKTVSDLANSNVKISLGAPKSVPAGQYALESLTYMNLWNKIQGKVIYAKDVEQVLTYIEQGEVAAGFVYNSDATQLKNSTAAEVLDEKSHKPIVYPCAIISESKKKTAAKAFSDYLSSGTARRIFKKYGFDVITR